ncbi:glucosaminidase domain-containing protein [Photobacterium leiognathi]|uniref:glucosaminidase domain-containing protein n=1 Tax=Photobacterium leiognathi TaxID=553611 RepID=UPI00298166E8|nr:glucosaminidase domain-containing protein [Photobacterium leiognathi]
MTKLKPFIILLTVLILFGFLWVGKQLLDNGMNTDSQFHPPKRPQFGSIININDKKKAFVDYLTPFVEEANKQILLDRQVLEELSQDPSKIDPDSHFIENLSEEYDLAIPKDGITSEWLNELLKRVNIIPTQLVLAQSAMESSWGTSRFALEGNGFFGQWCFTKGCGIPPHDLDPEHYHEVQSFPTVYAAVKAYFDNINTNDAYAELRTIRAKLQANHEKITADALAHGLLNYSQIGHQYIQQVLELIKTNQQFMPETTT